MHMLKKNPLLIVVLLLFIVLPFFNKSISFITDYFWFGEIALTNVFTKIFFTKVMCGLVGFLFTLTVLWLNLFVADKFSSGKVFIPSSMVGYAVFSQLSKFSLKVFFLITAVIAFFVGIWASGQWELYLQFINATAFNIADPLFKRDIGYYVFSLPFLRSAVYGITGILVVSFVVSVIIYIIRGGIYVASLPLNIPLKPRAHLLILGSIIIALFYFHFDFSLSSMVTRSSTILNGAGYADVNFEIPVLKFLKVASLIAAIFVLSSIFMRTLVFAGGVAVILLIGALVGSVGNQVLHKLVVAPNELSRETPYINLSIAGTQAAYNIDKIQEVEFSPTENLSRADLEENSATLKNIRLWDHKPLQTTYSQLQEIRTYYEFLDVDNDRYMIDGELRQVMLSPRELVPSSLPSRIWINERLSYTHGYGLCLGPVNQVTKEGLPEFFIKNIPPVASSSISVNRPEIYFGESDAGYVVVNTAAKEFDYPSGEQNVYSDYDGTGGIKIGNIFKRLLFVAHFKELKLLLSNDIKSDSRVLMYRQILQRVRHAAPFFKYDQDPYMVITDNGDLIWIVDGYTITDAYPYSYNSGGLNYIRNSVKVCVDAYNGDIKFYLSDDSDPIVKMYASMFPGMIQSIDKMPQDIRSHLRYPQSMFALQAKVYSTFHMTDPQVFYNKEDLWKVPGTQNGIETPMAPYYTIMKLAGVGDREEFILMVPFTPAKKDNMIAWLAARCDGDDYGKLLVFNFPKQKLVYGPRQIDSRINQDPEIARQLTLWNQGGSRVLRGSLLVIPVAQSLLFVQPLYIEAQGGGLPELKRVIVAFGNSIAMEENLELSLSRIFGSFETDGTKSKSLQSGTVSETALTQSEYMSSVKELISVAQNEYEKGQKALTSGDLGGYGDAMKRVRELINEMAKKVQ